MCKNCGLPKGSSEKRTNTDTAVCLDRVCIGGKVYKCHVAHPVEIFAGILGRLDLVLEEIQEEEEH